MTNKELARKIYDTGRNETTTGNWVFHISELDGRTPEECMYILLDEYREDILCSSTSAIAGWSAVSLLRNLASPVCFY